MWARFTQSPEEFLNTVGKDAMTQVGPLLTNVWHQDYPYNALCPIGYGNDRCAVGCVATSASQIMHYWQWPPAGQGENDYWWPGDSSCTPELHGEGQHLYADYSDNYDWTNMPDEADYDSPQEVIDAVSELCFEIGNAFYMDYGVCGSGVWPSAVQDTVIPAYEYNFRYMEGVIDQEYRTDWSTSSNYQWFQYVIKPEIDAGRPMQYFVTSHAFVCDGWRDDGGTRQYHFNYGWGPGQYIAWWIVDEFDSRRIIAISSMSSYSEEFKLNRIMMVTLI
jgi:hypothetical protein